MNPTLFYLIAGACISFMIGRVAIPRIILIAKRKRIFDTPNPRKIHTQQIPRLGGVSFLPGMLIAYFLIRGIQCTIGGNGMPDVETIYQETIFYFFTGLITIAAVGLWDDIIGLTYKYKLLVQLFVALLLVLPAGRIVNLEGIRNIRHTGLDVDAADRTHRHGRYQRLQPDRRDGRALLGAEHRNPTDADRTAGAQRQPDAGAAVRVHRRSGRRVFPVQLLRQKAESVHGRLRVADARLHHGIPAVATGFREQRHGKFAADPGNADEHYLHPAVRHDPAVHPTNLSRALPVLSRQKSHSS